MFTYLPPRRIKRGRGGLPVGLLAVGSLASLAHPAGAQELITNGSFEDPIAFAGWQTFAQTGSAGAFQRATGTVTAGEEFPSAGASDGAFYAVTDSLAPGTDGPGAYVLLQTFTRPLLPDTLTVRFDLFVNDFNGAGALNAGTLDFTQAAPTQFARVDLLTSSASAFSTDASDIVQGLYSGVDMGTPPNAYTGYTFDLSAVTTPGVTYQLRFASVQNQFSLNLGVDNVRVTAAASAAAPEPSALSLLLVLLPSLGAAAAHRARRTLKTEKETA